MLEYTVTVTNDSGIHARPAKVLVNELGKFKSDIRITAGNKTVNGKSIIFVISLGATKGTEVKFVFNGEDENEALEKVKDLFAHNLYE